MNRPTALVLSLFLLLLSPLTAQQEETPPQQGQAQEAPSQQPPPTVRAAGTTVIVDAVVVDKDNRVIKGLTKDDFYLSEDGRMQPIDSVIPRSGLAVNAEVGSSGAQAGSSAPADGAAAARLPNFIVFLLDYASTEFQNQHLVEKAAKRYVENNLQPDDFAAVFAVDSGLTLLQPFTNDAERLSQAFELRTASGASMNQAAGSGFSLSNADMLRAGNVDPTQLQVSADSAGGAGLQAAGLAAAAAFSEAGRLLLALRMQQLRYNMGSYLNKREAYSILSAVQAVAQAFREVEGRKSLILFSQGFVVGSETEAEFRRTIEMASLARVAVYGLDPQGLLAKQNSGDLLPQDQLSSISAANGRNRIQASGGESIFDRARQTGSDTRDSALRHLAGSTGGFAVRNTNDLYVGLKRIDEDMRSHYLIVYRPTDQSLDGRFREIIVGVRDRSDLEVRHRVGYRAVPRGLENLAADELELVMAAQNGTLPADLPVYLRTDTFHLPGLPQEVLVTIDLASDQVEFLESRADGRVEGANSGRVAQLKALGLVRDKSGEIVRRFGLPISVRATEEDYQELLKGGLSLSHKLDLLPGDYSFQVLVQDLTSKRLGSTERSLRVRPRPERLAFSTIVVGEQLSRSNNQPGELSAEGMRILPSARRQFREGERLVYYLEIYNADPAQAPEVQVSVQRSGSQEKLPLPVQRPQAESQEARHLTLARYIELAGLAPGAYNLLAEATDPQSGQKVQARTAFRIVE